MRPARSVGFVFVALLFVIGGWPYVPLLETWPRAPDSVVWVLDGSPAASWREWAFETRQFGVGYRPLMALSFTLTEALGGSSPSVHRLIDLFLHLGAAGLLVGLVRVLGLPLVAGLAAGALFLALPCAEDVVPYLARRSYSLASCFALLGLFFSLGTLSKGDAALRPGLRVAVSIGVGLLLVAALFTHEASLIAVAALPALHLARPRDAGARPFARLASTCLVPLVLVAVAWFVRSDIVGGIGGYDAVESERAVRRLPIALASLRGLVFPSGEAAGPVALEWAWVGAVLVALVQVLRGVHRGIGLVSILGLAAYAGAYAQQGVWFDRQAYFMAVPAALFLASVVASAKGRVGALPALLLFALAAVHSPLVRGLDAPRLARWLEQDRLTEALMSVASAHESGERLLLVLPYTSGGEGLGALRARSERRDLSRLHRAPAKLVSGLAERRGVSVEESLYYDPASLGDGDVGYEHQAGRHVVLLPVGSVYQESQGRGFRRRDAKFAARVILPVQAQDAATLWIHRGTGAEEIALVPSSE